MKKICLLLSVVLILGITSCGNSSVKIDENLSKEEARAVVKTEKSLPRGSQIIDYQVVKTHLPLALLDTEYKNLRDQVFKARIDYRANVARGLKDYAQRNLETLKGIQSQIVYKDSSLTSGSPLYMFVLANVKEPTRKDGKDSGYIAIFDQETLDMVDLIQVTQPLYNNAVMVTEALNGTLANPDPTPVEKLKFSNPVVEFILNSNPK